MKLKTLFYKLCSICVSYIDHFSLWLLDQDIAEKPNGRLLRARTGHVKGFRQGKIRVDMIFNSFCIGIFIRLSIRSYIKGICLIISGTIADAEDLPFTLKITQWPLQKAFSQLQLSEHLEMFNSLLSL